MWGLFWCVFPEKSTYIIIFPSRHNESINDDKKTIFICCSRVSHAHFSLCWWRHNPLLMMSQLPDNCDAIMWIVVSNLSDVDFIQGDIHGLSCKKCMFFVLLYLFGLCVRCIQYIPWNMSMILFCFVLLWLYKSVDGVIIIDSLILFRVTSLALGQSYDCPSTSEVTLKLTDGNHSITKWITNQVKNSWDICMAYGYGAFVLVGCFNIKMLSYDVCRNSHGGDKKTYHLCGNSYPQCPIWGIAIQ